ncbi:MAG: S-adenosylmethionine decarboxylase [Vicinamibacterales bacterium]
MRGTEWIVDASGCDAAALRDPAVLAVLFSRIVDLLQLTPVSEPIWHAFPAPGGLTGFVVLAESHLACHTFPEFGSICLNVFCCRPRPAVDLVPLLRALLGTSHASVRQVEREYAGDARSLS